jgi:post-segregation antitoxin (ccd killing protein)
MNVKPDTKKGRVQEIPTRPIAERRAGVSEAGLRWLEENADAIKSYNDWIENGLPLGKYRSF